MKDLVLSNEKIENLIYEIRGKQVMLDRDLAKLYNIETRVLIQKVKRNIERFPTSFCFQMSEEEYLIWRSQFVISKEDKKGLRRAPYVFTEQGVAMLSAVLKTSVAIIISTKIMDAFVSMRKYMSENFIEQKFINNQVMKNTEDIRQLQESFKKFEEKKVVNEIYFKGQIYDAYSKILDIVKEGKQEVIIIDNYADKSILDIVRKVNYKVIVITKKNNEIEALYSKYCKQYSNLKIIYDNSFHDRYFIIDNEKIYHCGASINYAGSKTFSINLLEDEFVKKALIENVNNITYSCV